MALVKDEWVIRSNSGIGISTANSYVRSQLDVKQDDSSNLDLSGSYIDNFFADIFDSRDGSLYRVYSTGATNNPSVIAGDSSNSTDGYFTLVGAGGTAEGGGLTGDDLIPYAKKTELPDLTDYRVENEIIQIVDGKIDNIQIDEVIIG